MNMTKKNEKQRPPVVVVLGHVDHGKTSLLDFIRKTEVTAGESGGITQHVGAYEIDHNGKKITFIDTPGHEAFSAIRSRGAKAADIAILVVAADEGMKEQTKEAISHIKKAEIPMIVALNKMDKPEANPEKTKGELTKQEVIVESLGGTIPSVNISAKTGDGVKDLLEVILLIAEMEELKDEREEIAEGTIIESFMDIQRGPVATVIVQKGTLNKGDFIGTSSAVGKIKILEDFQGKQIEKAFPSMPAIVLGFENVPGVGDVFKAHNCLEEACLNVKEKIFLPKREIQEESDKKTLNVVLKADVAGSLEALEAVLNDLPQEKSLLRILKAEVGEINESDVKTAKNGQAAVVGFRVKVGSLAKGLAEREKVRIKTFDIIYELVQSVRLALEKIIEAETVRNDLGKVKVLAIFRTDKSRQIIGGKVQEGKIKKSHVEVYRNEQLIGKGRIISLQRDKKEIDEVAKGYECGMLYEGNVKVEQGDILYFFIEEKRKIEI